MMGVAEVVPKESGKENVSPGNKQKNNPSRNESQGSGGYEGSGGECRKTKGRVSRHIPQEGEDVGGAVVVGVGGGRGGAGGGGGGG